MSTTRRQGQPNRRLKSAQAAKRTPPPRQGGPSRRLLLIGLVGVVVLAAVAGAVWQLAGGDDGGRSAVVVSRLQTTTLDAVSRPTWDPNYQNLSEVVEALDLPGVSENILHEHAHLTLYAGGRQVIVPANIGYDEPGQQFSPIHTHDERGVIHIEADRADFQATLQHVFDVWGVMLTPERVGGYRGAQLWVNGEPVEGDPGAYEIEAHDEITLLAGDEPDGFEPRDSYRFEPGE
jgi:hypothetical protein